MSTEYDQPPASIALVRPEHQADNECYQPWRSYDHGYTDGRYFGGKRRPGATRGRDANYDVGFALGILDRLELDKE